MIFKIKLITIISLLSFQFCLSQKYYQAKDKNVGDIDFDNLVDNIAFSKCNENYSFEYYNIFNGFQYKGEKYEILKLWREITNLKEKNNNSQVKDGYITARFLINCKGKAGLFRIQQMDENYQEINFNITLVNEILNFVKSLDGWVIGENNGVKVDYYQYLTFKIENGIVKEILP
ncbi:hypothetical protein [Chryseobacterium sp.]|uniref:hypothetical protein n=1 Tax=Chryseobacterium sp. TaxID=1871047 RepID=UPI00289AC8F2|nr:hypothetical protein [Chryseobacterium sp.]